jgi:hypothetical protein
MSGCDIIFYVNICRNFPLFCLCCGLFCGLLVGCPTDTPPPPADTFMLYDSEGPNASGNWGKKLGVNTIPIYFDGWTVVQTVLDDFCASFDKEAYLWAFGYPADNSDNLPFVYPRAGGYSEEWQKEQYVATLGMLLDNPKVIGASIDLFDYQESGWASPFHWGLVQGDRAHPETCVKRPAFDAVKEYWEEHRR